MDDLAPAQQLALWADKLRDVSALGLRFAANVYDRDHYQAVQDVAMGMLAMAAGETLAQMEPLRAPIFARPTPFAVGDGAVIDEEGRLLLIRRADNNKWALPGGAFEVGETPAEGVVRDVFEETGVRCVPTALVAVHDSRLLRGVTRHQLYMFMFLCRPLDEDMQPATPSHAHEVLDAQWFPIDALPVDLDPLHVDRIPEAVRVWRGDERAFFDRST